MTALSLLAAAATARPALSQQPTGQGAVLLIMDSSGSMNGDDGRGRPKIDAAKDALRTLVDGLQPGAPVGLRVYGHRVPNTDKVNGCKDTELVFPVRPADPAAMKAAIGSYRATGFTPIGYSLQEAAKDLPPEGDRTIVLISDGQSTCGDPCPAAHALKHRLGEGFRIDTVGFRTPDQAESELRVQGPLGREDVAAGPLQADRRGDRCQRHPGQGEGRAVPDRAALASRRRRTFGRASAGGSASWHRQRFRPVAGALR